MKWYDFWGVAWLIGWMFTLGMFMAISIPISFLESSITVLLLAIAWPFFLGLGLGPGGMLR